MEACWACNFSSLNTLSCNMYSCQKYLVLLKNFFLESSRLIIDIVLARRASSAQVESASMKTAARGTSGQGQGGCRREAGRRIKEGHLAGTQGTWVPVPAL